MDGGGLAEFEGGVITLWRCHGDLYLARPDGSAEQRLAAVRNPPVALRTAVSTRFGPPPKA